MKKLSFLLVITFIFWYANSQTDFSIIATNTKSIDITKIDTVRVVMLVCDTIRMRPFNQPIWRTDGPSKIENGVLMYRYPPVYWLFGYKVSSSVIYPTSGFPVWEIYLNEKKQPLPEGIIVWQSIITK